MKEKPESQESAIHNPHDSVVKKFFTTSTMKEFLKNYFPSELLEEINLASLSLCDTEFISSELVNSSADLLFKAGYKNVRWAYVYILFEHKSQPERTVALQLLKYMTSIWSKEKSELVLPIVFYHGKYSWNVETSFQASVFPELPKIFRSCMPEFEYWLFDVRTLGDLDIEIASELQALLLTLKALSSKDPYDYLEKHSPMMLKWITDTSVDKEKLESLMRYLADQTSVLDDYKQFETQLIKQGAKMPSVLEQLTRQGLEQGLEQGREEGLEKGLEQVARKMLGKGYSLTEIAEVTGMEEMRIEALK